MDNDLLRVYKERNELPLDIWSINGQSSVDDNNDGETNEQDFQFIFQTQTKNSKESVLEAQYMAGARAVNSGHQLHYTSFHITFNLPECREVFGVELTQKDTLNV